MDIVELKIVFIMNVNVIGNRYFFLFEIKCVYLYNFKCL